MYVTSVHRQLVNHVIKGGGVAITGQEQRQYGGGFLEGDGAPKGSGGMLGEITQLQMYSVALTAGKAYRDHKHHHGNYNSDPAQPARSTTTTPAPQPGEEPDDTPRDNTPIISPQGRLPGAGSSDARRGAHHASLPINGQ